VVALTALEALVFESWPALAAAAALALADALGRRSPYEALARLVSAPPSDGVPFAPALIAAVVRAALLGVATALLAADALGAAWAVGAVVIVTATASAVSGRPLLGLPARGARAEVPPGEG
jgi:subtilisin family serine protease